MFKCHGAQSSDLLSSVQIFSKDLIKFYHSFNYQLYANQSQIYSLSTNLSYGPRNLLVISTGYLREISNLTSEIELLVLYHSPPKNTYVSFSSSHLRTGISIHPVG